MLKGVNIISLAKAAKTGAGVDPSAKGSKRAKSGDHDGEAS